LGGVLLTVLLLFMASTISSSRTEGNSHSMHHIELEQEFGKPNVPAYSHYSDL
jgi:hypothetical protein